MEFNIALKRLDAAIDKFRFTKENDCTLTREEIDQLEQFREWAYTDLAYKAPEYVQECVDYLIRIIPSAVTK